MTVVVVGSKLEVAPQLVPLGLGALDERDPFGNPLGAVPVLAKPTKAKATKK